MCNWVGKLSVERLSGDCGAILRPYARARFLAPTAAKVARAEKLVGWFGFGGGGAAIKNTPRLIIRKKIGHCYTHGAASIVHATPVPLKPNHVFSVSKIFCRPRCRCDGGRCYCNWINTISPRHTDKSNTPTAAEVSAVWACCCLVPILSNFVCCYIAIIRRGGRCCNGCKVCQRFGGCVGIRWRCILRGR